MSILIVTPTYRFEPETRAALFHQTYAGDVDYFWTADNPYPDSDAGKANILYNYRKAAQVCLDGGYSAMWVVESDIIPPLDALERLTAVQADLAYGVYLYRRGEPFPCNVLRYVKAPSPDQPLSNYPDDYKKSWGKVIKCSGSGLGCVLINREVLGKIDFRESESHCDTAFTSDVYQAGFSMKADMAVLCGHKIPDGRIVYPTEDGKGRWEQGDTEGYRGVMGDPTELIEKHRSDPRLFGRDFVRVLLKQSYIGPEIRWDAGNVVEVNAATATRMIQGGGAELVDGN